MDTHDRIPPDPANCKHSCTVTFAGGAFQNSPFRPDQEGSASRRSPSSYKRNPRPASFIQVVHKITVQTTVSPVCPSQYQNRQHPRSGACEIETSKVYLVSFTSLNATISMNCQGRSKSKMNKRKAQCVHARPRQPRDGTWTCTHLCDDHGQVLPGTSQQAAFPSSRVPDQR
jgi:hypothetical protein